MSNRSNCTPQTTCLLIPGTPLQNLSLYSETHVPPSFITRRMIADSCRIRLIPPSSSARLLIFRCQHIKLNRAQIQVKVAEEKTMTSQKVNAFELHFIHMLLDCKSVLSYHHHHQLLTTVLLIASVSKHTFNQSRSFSSPSPSMP